MKRRDFLRLAATSSGMLMCGGVQLAQAQQSYNGPFWLLVEARGGWDPTSFCDPKGSGLGENGDINNYDQNDIRQIGNIRYAPPPDMFASNTSLFSNQDFFEAHYQNMVVINGINYGTNGHNVGMRAGWTGSKVQDYPSIAALIASENAGELSLPFVGTNPGSITKTNNLVPATLIKAGNVTALREVAYPNRMNTTQSAQYSSNSAQSLIEAAAASRRQRQLNAQRLTRLRTALSEHDASRNRDVSTLRDFVDTMGSPSSPNSYVNSRGDARFLFQNAQTAFAAFESGAAATAQITINGFDTHSNHDANQYPLLMDLFAAVDNIISDANARGIGDRLIIVMGSDFGRTNKINEVNGKDHWPHTSMMAWGDNRYFSGNRVVGATDDLHRSLKVNTSTLQPDNNGVELTPEYIHQALRSLAGIDQNPSVTSNFPFGQGVLPIFA
ncbi:MAG: DUF1501 domain-containing protein [Rhodothermales bacterium]|nr:DUF1501 domain-containing protein [Rhodothermales bacterium]